MDLIIFFPTGAIVDVTNVESVTTDPDWEAKASAILRELGTAFVMQSAWSDSHVNMLTSRVHIENNQAAVVFIEKCGGKLLTL